MASPTEVDYDSAASETGSVQIIMSAAVGDLLVAIHMMDFSTAANMTTPTGTTGTWTQEALADSGSNNSHIKVWSRLVTSAGNQTVNFNQSVATGRHGHLFAFRDFGDPAITAAGNNGTGTAAVAPSISGANAGDLLICAWGDGGNADTVTAITPPGSMVDRGMTTDGPMHWSNLRVATEVLSSSGATGTRTATLASEPWVAVSIVISGIPDPSATRFGRIGDAWTPVVRQVRFGGIWIPVS